MRKISLLVLQLFILVLAHAQTQTLKGRVMDKNLLRPLSGYNISAFPKSKSASFNFDSSYFKIIAVGTYYINLTASRLYLWKFPPISLVLAYNTNYLSNSY
ncbi:MAG: hypothetical protein PSX81_08175 [bacterium]|nr:hypothetical protein [bacterium]